MASLGSLGGHTARTCHQRAPNGPAVLTILGHYRDLRWRRARAPGALFATAALKTSTYLNYDAWCPGGTFTRDTSSAQTFKNYKKYSLLAVPYNSLTGSTGV